MYTIQTINYKNTTKSGHVVLYMYVRCNETGKKFQVKGHSEVDSTFFKPKKTVVRFDRGQIDSQDRLVRGLIVSYHSGGVSIHARIRRYEIGQVLFE
jgi:hypothetical protein